MADAAVEFLLQNLKQIQEYDLLGDAEKEIEKLTQELHHLKAFLEGTTKMHTEDKRRRELIQSIVDAVYDVEDAVDEFVCLAAMSKRKNYLLRCFQKPKELPSISAKVDSFCDKIGDPSSDDSRIDFSDKEESPENLEVRLERQDNVVGFEDETEILTHYLFEQTQQLDVTTVFGMPGIGKTTLARKVFNHPRIQDEFPIRIWVSVSEKFTKRCVFLTILRWFSTLTQDIYGKSDQELGQLVASYLDRKKYLIVMDDVWKIQHWDILQKALPKINELSKVLITTRNEEVARYSNLSRDPLQLRFLTQEQSWLLLQLMVFGKPECPRELEVLGKLIAEQCDGLPLAIVTVGGILAKEYFSSQDMKASRSAWRKTCQSVKTYLNQRFYNNLPYHLQDCFLYFGMFPKDYDISVSQLIRLWIAEGFLRKKDGLNLEEIAEEYLNELIGRNLICIGKRKSDGKLKTCRIHEMLREFCITEAGNRRENFLQEINRSSDGEFEPPLSDIQKSRRLCIHSNVLNFISSKAYGPRVRSFVCFSREEITLSKENISLIPAAFKLLRVLDVKPIKFTRIPSDFYHLFHLRYISLSLNSSILPPAFSGLWNIQTLIVDTSSRTLEIEADIWKLIQLMYFKTNASATLPKTSETSKYGEKLQTLGTISPKSCSKEVFERARNLKRLGIRGRLALLLDAKNGYSFDNLGKLGRLEKLTLLNDVYPSPPPECQLHGLPTDKFPPKLISLRLSNTLLDWSHMSTLACLENLKFLKLEDNAFMGKIWETADGGFHKLEVLNIGRTDLVIWKASRHHFPRLRRLMLRNCEKLQEVPIGLADIPSLQLLDLYQTKLAVASAKKLQEAKQKNLEKENAKVSLFKLSIVPPHE